MKSHDFKISVPVVFLVCFASCCLLGLFLFLLFAWSYLQVVTLSALAFMLSPCLVLHDISLPGIIFKSYLVCCYLQVVTLSGLTCRLSDCLILSSSCHLVWSYLQVVILSDLTFRLSPCLIFKLSSCLILPSDCHTV